LSAPPVTDDDDDDDDDLRREDIGRFSVLDQDETKWVMELLLFPGNPKVGRRVGRLGVEGMEDRLLGQMSR